MAYLAPARGRPNLTVLPDTDVRRVVFKDGAVAGVEVRTKGAIQTIEAPHVVLACGAIHTPAVLVRSGIGPRDVLDRLGVGVVSALEGVGRNLMDHPAIGPTLYPREGDVDWEMPVIQTTLRYTATGSDDRNDMQLEPLTFMHQVGGRMLSGIAACVFKSYSRGWLEFDERRHRRAAAHLLELPLGRARLREATGRSDARDAILRNELDRSGHSGRSSAGVGGAG